MLPIADIQQRLQEIDASYQSETDTIKALLWAKLAALEVGGWTEECIDKIITDFVNAKNPPSKTKILERLKKVYGFQYSKEFRPIVVEVVGSVLFDKIETNINLQCQQLESALASLKQSRDISAHTYTKSDSAIDAPSKMIDLLTKISAGLSAFNTELYQLQI
ncbi:MAG: hypothetical protein V1897_15150 [Pseudomonadota bacterium]